MLFFSTEDPYNILDEYEQFVFSYRNMQQMILEQEKEKKRQEQERENRMKNSRNNFVERNKILVFTSYLICSLFDDSYLKMSISTNGIQP